MIGVEFSFQGSMNWTVTLIMTFESYVFIGMEAWVGKGVNCQYYC